MSTRRAPALAAAALMAALLAGCGGAAAPAPSTPSPISDEEAFAAAEATYRAYVDALNAVDLADPATFEPVYDWLEGPFEAEERENFSKMHAEGWSISGSSTVIGVSPVSVSEHEMSIAACVDVSSVVLRDGSGASAVASDRPPIQAIVIELRPSTTTTGWAITKSVGAQNEPTC